MLFRSILTSLKNSYLDFSYGTYNIAYPKDIVALGANQFSQQTNDKLIEALPYYIVSDAKYIAGKTDPSLDVLNVVEKTSPQHLKILDHLIAELMCRFGAHSRNFLRSILAP